MNLSNTTELNIEYEWAIVGNYILENYIIRAIGGIGIVFNALYAKILLNKSLKHKIYDFFLCRVICNVIVCIFVAGNVERCFECESDSYWFLFYQYFINGIGIKIVSFASFISDIFLILNRYLEISKKNILFWKQMSKKLTLLLCFSLPILVAVPAFFSVTIEKRANGLFIKELNRFGTSQIYKFYLIALFMIETVIPIVTISVLNVFSILESRKQTRIHRNLTNKQRITKKSEDGYSKIVIILTTICITSRLLDLATNLLFRLDILHLIMFSEDMSVLTKFSLSLTNLLLFIIHGKDGLVYLKMDRNLWTLNLAMYGQKQVCVLKKTILYIFKTR